MQRIETMLRKPGARQSSRLSLGAVVTGCFLLLVLLAVSDAQVPSAITPDGILGTRVTPEGRVFNITGGTRPGQGPNLFHSFGQFDVGTGDTAHFVGQPGIDNIIGRVTGGSESLIDGCLQSDASLFLLNPSGLMFGPNATLDVNGSFHASTADALRFADGAIFSAHLNAKSTLTVAPPVAFGFLSENPAGIVIEGSVLEVPEDDTVSMVGGDIQIVGGTLKASGGQVHLVSLASSGEVIPASADQSPELTADTAERLGKIALTQEGHIDASGVGGGAVLIRGGRLLVDRATIEANTWGNRGGNELTVQVSGDVVLTNGSSLTTKTSGAGAAGPIRISAGNVLMDEAAQVASSTSAAGDAGMVVVEASRVTLSGGAQIGTFTSGEGQGGKVTVQARERVTLEGITPNGVESGIVTYAQRQGRAAGDAGMVVVEAPQVTLTGGAQIRSNTSGKGQGGTVRVTATEAVSLEASGINANAEAAGDAGMVVVEAPQVTLTGGAQIASGTSGEGQGGKVTVQARERVTLEGITPNGVESGIVAYTQGQGKAAGDAGMVVVEAPQVTLTGGARITSNTSGEGQGSTVRVTATEVVSLEASGINAYAQGQGKAAGDAGMVVVEAPQVTLKGGAQIGSSTLGPGQGGSVKVWASETVTLEGTDRNGAPSGIFANAEGMGEGTGDGGTVVVDAPQITLTGGARITSNTSGEGQGGTVTVTATEGIAITDQNSEGVLSGVFTNTTGQGRGGDITLSAPQVQLVDGSTVSAGSAGKGDAGNIRIAAQEVALRGNSAVTTKVEQGEASGGNILIGRTITDNGVITGGIETLTLDGSQITADTDRGSEANITIGVQRLVLDGASGLTANTGAGTGGNLRVAGAVTADGTITARADTVVLRGSKLTANAETGTGGRIDIVTEAFLKDTASDVNASSQAGGIDGVVNVEAVVSNLSEIVTPLPPDFASAASLLRDQCVAQLREGQLNSLVVSGRAGIPARPGGILPSPVFRAERDPMGTPKQAEPLAKAVASHPEADGAPAQDMRQGWTSFHHGDFEQAVRHWQQAVRALEREGEADQQSMALAHLAHAYQKLGHYQQALQRLQAAQTLAEKSGDRVLKAFILGELGNVHIPLGLVNQASQYLHDGLRLARAMKADDLVATVLNNLGNLFASQEAFDEALRAYRESARLAKLTDKHALTARALTHAALLTLRRGKPQEAQTLVDQAFPMLQALSPSHEKAYGLVSIGLLYANLRSHLPAMDATLLQLALRSFNDAIAMAQATSDARAASYAWGYLGNLYEGEGRYQEALALTRRAVFAVQFVQASEASYLWQWQSGRVLQALGQRKAAIDAYRQAVETLQAMRDEMLVAYGEPLRFRETVEPLYAEFVGLLLQPGAAEEALEEARQLLESLKVAELQNYFQDECVAALRLRETSLDEVSQTAVVVYPVLLPDRTELLVSLPTGAGASKLQRFTVAIGEDRITEEVRAFRRTLENRITWQYLQHAQTLYDWLIRPLEVALATRPVTTLVFVPDGALRTIPMAALHDGEQFLIQKYALAITPGLNLTNPRPLPQPARVLAAGLTRSRQGLSALPYVKAELQAIANLYKSHVLLNQDFKLSRLEKTLERGLFPIVHIASHGQFSSDLGDTFIHAADGKLTLERLNQLLDPLRFRDEPIELLTLSACQTAAGDDQAALGLAGVAIRAGARSALATLWFINDEASSELVAEFYRQLHAPAVSRATALQRAQIHLLDDPDYQHPAFWAPFLLINNWL
jgi:filamentous hemagglutinin family protein